MAINGSNMITDATMTAEMETLGRAYAAGQDAWPMAFRKFAAWGYEGFISSATEDKAKGTVDKVKLRVADFLKTAKKQDLSFATVQNKEGEMRAAVELGEYCKANKVDVVKLLVNVHEALTLNRDPKVKVKSMQTLNAFTHVSRQFRKKKANKLWTTKELQTIVKAPITKKAPPAIIERWKAEARTLGLLTGIVTPETASEKHAFAKVDTDENSVKVAAAVIAYVNKMTAPAEAKKAPVKASTGAK